MNYSYSELMDAVGNSNKWRIINPLLIHWDELMRESNESSNLNNHKIFLASRLNGKQYKSIIKFFILHPLSFIYILLSVKIRKK